MIQKNEWEKGEKKILSLLPIVMAIDKKLNENHRSKVNKHSSKESKITEFKNKTTEVNLTSTRLT